MQQASKNNVPLEPVLTDLILRPKSEKIRRPPNAFMLFAREHRRRIAVQHPNVCNKSVSTILGKVWRTAPGDVKSRYYEKARMLGELHKRRYPNYVYSPREARIQKMNKKKRNKEETSYIDSLQKTEEPRADMTSKIKEEENLNEEGSMTIMETDRQSDSLYVPNNPGYFGQQGPDTTSDDEQEYDEPPPQGPHPMDFQRQSESWDTPNKTVEGWDPDAKNRRGHTSPGMCKCCDGGNFGFPEKPISPLQRPVCERIDPYYPDYLRCTYASPPPFCNPPGYFGRPMSPYCCSPPPSTSPGLRPYRPPFLPYWNSPPMNSACCPSREHVYENLKPYPTSYHTPAHFGHQFSYFNRHSAPFIQRPGYKIWQPLNEKPDNFQQGQNEPFSKHSESIPSHRQNISKGHNYFHSCVGNSAVDEEMALNNERILGTNIGNDEGTKNQNICCGRGTRRPVLANPFPSGPVTEDEVYPKEDHGDKFSQKDKNNEISACNFVSRPKCQPLSADNIHDKKYAIFDDCISRAQVRSRDSPNYVEFSECNSDQNNFGVHNRSEEESNLPGCAESYCNQYKLKNSYVADVPPKLRKISSSSFCDSPKIHSWSTPAMKSELPDNIPQDECDRSLSKLDQRSISNTLQNNIFTEDELSASTLSTVSDSNYTSHSQNDSENVEYNVEMQCEPPNQTTMEFFSDSHNYPTTSKYIKQESMPEFPI